MLKNILMKIKRSKNRIALEENDAQFLQFFIDEPFRGFAFISDTHDIHMIIEYYAFSCMHLMNQRTSLGFPLEDLSNEERKIVDHYLNQYGSNDDKISYMYLKIAIMILFKYYNENGKIKDKYLISI